MQRLFILCLAMLAASCASTTDTSRERVETQLPFKEVVQYRNVETFKGGVNCGEVNATGRWGDETGYLRYIVLKDREILRPTNDDWVVYCSDDPVAAVELQFNIFPVDRSNTALLRVVSDLQMLDRALQAYLLADQRAYPSTKEGLAALSLESTPIDPWGQPYLYERVRVLHPLPPQYRLLTLGKDGQPGGSGDDADIGSWHLPYLEYALQLY
tara:strand:+ start:65024 stop:65662 length:639 start_codon:yes stop_codon:yes gene_type:complete